MMLLGMRDSEGIRFAYLFVCRFGSWWTLRSVGSVVDVPVNSSSMYMGHLRYTSSGLGGLVRSSPFDTNRNQASRSNVLIILPFLMLLLLMLHDICIHFSYSIIIQTQRNFELFKLIKYSYSRRLPVVHKQNIGFA